MRRRIWDSKTKTKIVLEGLSGRAVSEICDELGRSISHYLTGSLVNSSAHAISSMQ